MIASHVADKASDFTTHGAGGGLIRTNLAGPGVRVTTIVVDVLLPAVLCLLWVRLARSKRDTREDLLRYAAGSLATVLVLGTVLSPQYVVWLIPLVPLIGGARGTAAILLFVVAGALTTSGSRTGTSSTRSTSGRGQPRFCWRGISRCSPSRWYFFSATARRGTNESSAKRNPIVSSHTAGRLSDPRAAASRRPRGLRTDSLSGLIPGSP